MKLLLSRKTGGITIEQDNQIRQRLQPLSTNNENIMFINETFGVMPDAWFLLRFGTEPHAIFTTLWPSIKNFLTTTESMDTALLNSRYGCRLFFYLSRPAYQHTGCDNKTIKRGL
jgi:hypothetical protein